MGIKYKILTEENIDKTSECIAKSFATNDVLSIALNIGLKDWKTFAKQETLKSIEDKLSIIAFDDDKLIGAHLSYDFSNYNTEDYATQESFLPISKLMKELHKNYNPTGKIIHFSYVGVSPDYTKRRIAYEMAIRNINLAKTNGFEKIILEATSPYSQRNTEKLGFEKINEIFYKDFEYKGEKIFSEIIKTPSCMLMQLKLREEFKK